MGRVTDVAIAYRETEETMKKAGKLVNVVNMEH